MRTSTHNIVGSLLDEYRKLNSKINRLVKFSGTEKFNSLSNSHQELLELQFDAMDTYSVVLNKRIILLMEGN